MIPIGDKLDQETHCHGTVNGQDFDLTGGGTGRPFEGHVDTSLNSTKGPMPFPPPLISPVLIMGYPTFSNYLRGCFDLFKISNGYEYERHFKFENGGTMDTVHKITYHGTKLTGDFKVTQAKVQLPKLATIEPTVETFMPAGPGKIRSKMLLAWRLEDGSLFSADIESEYRLTHTAELPWIQFRHIEFSAAYTPTTVKQSERLTVFRAGTAFSV